ncbi:phage tail tape measure protein [Enterobacter cloacae complex sp. EB5]|uniref:phage tail tape measure protein n=1 Tax=Enterobacter cloacae complex TaxID=354276 RepID=UPI00079AC3AB|nr:MULTISPECIES: phage tail tape measure protein [Enterobacter cloacae complex]OWS93615.1 phage tail tape measure protein [Enterobacter hormaechei]RAZ03281.1 phage tail tape measure protein [Enterobacter hormaechei subsp. xiangfangensis]RAZ27663.1 phage tail tape measure protein [Enterobacter hormaechei subsp. xiangfangensis]WMY43887.1 phage tail tape measure protein [Enterobacter cloacae complex sp. EB5]CZZ61054.1 Phage tail length tape-measure protein 1 [Enterobacter hormaechei]
MATLRELIIKISANSQSFQSEISRASRMGQDYYRTMQNGGRQAAAAARESERALSDLTAGFASAGRAAAAATAAFATGKIVQIADEWNSVNARLKQASSSADDFAASQRQLMEISQRTGTAFSDNANLFSRAAASMREYGYSSDEVLKITEAVSTGLKLSGANTQEASSVITQFSQALAQGVLRGEEFNAVNEAGDRVIRALAAGMGVARKDLKSMADQGQLTIDKVVPALMSQLGALQGEFASMPQTVSGSLQKVTNSFMAWVGGVNQATGATDALSGGLDNVAQTLDSFTSSAVSGALSDVADNMSTITTVAGALVGVGLARYLSGVVTSATSATGALISAAKSEVALAVAQDKAAQSAVAASRAEVYRAQQAVQRSRSADVQAAQQEKIAAAEAKVTAAQARLTTALASGTATEKVRARTALERAQAGLVAAKNADAQAIAERRLSATQASLSRNLANRVSTQSNLNSVTSVGTRLMSGALGLIGGVPGLVMLGAGAWYAMYQNQEQARRSAQEYASQIDEIREKTSRMSLSETDDNRGRTVGALVEQNRLIDEQAKKVRNLKDEIDKLNSARGQPGITSVNDADILRAIAIATDQLAVEEGKLNGMRDKSRGIQQALEEIERRRNDLIREQAWRQNAVYQSMIMMNGQHTEFNRLLGLGNQLLMARQGLANVPLRLPQADLDKKQTDALEKSRRDLELSRLKGEAKERLRLSYAADDLGLTSDPQFQTGRQELINNGLAEWRNNEANKPKAKVGKTEGEKTEDVYKRLIKQQKEQIALQGQNTELAKVKYQVSQGELASLTEAQKKTVLQNAALIDQVKLREQLRNYEANLADSNASARAANEAQLLGYGQGTRFRERLQEQFNLRKEFEQKNTDLLRQRQAGEIDETFYQQGLALNKRYLEERLRDQEGYYAASDAQRDDWMTGLSEGYANWVDEATDYSSMAADGMKQAMGGAVTTITDMLNGNVDSWKDWGVSVLKIIQNVLVNMAVANGVSSIGSLFSFGASSAATASGGTAIQNAGANFTFNAKGNVYDSPSLSAYSNGVFQTPQLFAFAKGAGVFAEAGPEAIMPLTRAADGSLGVRAVGTPQVSGGVPSVNFGDINIQGGSPQASSQGTAGAAGRQLKDAITGVINEQASMPGSPLWRLIKGV